jgi:hypothetical protein
MGDRERRKKKLREREAKARQRQERQRVKVRNERALEAAEERALIEADQKLLRERRPSLEDYRAKLSLLRSLVSAEHERFFEELLDDPARDFDLDDMLEVFAYDLDEKTSSPTLRSVLRDPDLAWHEILSAVVEFADAKEADVLRVLVAAAEYPASEEEYLAEREAQREAHERMLKERQAEPAEAPGPSETSWIASLAPWSSGASRAKKRPK